MPVTVAVPAPAERAAHGVVSGVRTLIVDHDLMVARIHRGFTERVPGFDVVGVAYSGAEALAAIDRLRPELVLLDVHLPDVSGLAVLRELRQREPTADVMVVTTSSDVAALQAALEYGALRYIMKPFDFARFRQTLEATTAIASGNRRLRSL
jgi:response regulator of citrate/malate metabolism